MQLLFTVSLDNYSCSFNATACNQPAGKENNMHGAGLGVYDNTVLVMYNDNICHITHDI